MINKSVDQFTKNNNSILLNPIIAKDTKEQNLIISPSQKEMDRLSKGLQEFGGRVRLITKANFKINRIGDLSNRKITEFLTKVPQKELVDALQKVRLLR